MHALRAIVAFLFELLRSNHRLLTPHIVQLRYSQHNFCAPRMRNCDHACAIRRRSQTASTGRHGLLIAYEPSLRRSTLRLLYWNPPRDKVYPVHGELLKDSSRLTCSSTKTTQCCLEPKLVSCLADPDALSLVARGRRWSWV